jgi:acetyl esterase/lipase
VGAYTDESSKVQAVVDMAGPSDLLTMGNQGDSFTVAETFVDLLGHVPHNQIGADLRAASPVTYIASGDPPFLLMHSTDDEIVYPQQSQEMAWDLAANHVPHELVMVDGGGHEFDNAGEQPTEAGIAKAIVQFFIRTLVFHEPLTSAPISSNTGSTGSTGSIGSAGNAGSSGNTGNSGTTTTTTTAASAAG